MLRRGRIKKPGRWVRPGFPSGCASDAMAQKPLLPEGGLRASSAVDAHHHYQQRFSLLTRKIAVRFCTEILRNTFARWRLFSYASSRPVPLGA